MTNIINGGKATIEGAVIHCFIRDQEGNLQPMKIKNTLLTQYFVQWLQRHDGYSGVGPS